MVPRNVQLVGQAAFNSLPKQQLLSFPNAEKVEELENEVVHIVLFDVLANPEKHRERQKSFREWMQLDNLEVKLDVNPLKDMSDEEAEQHLLNMIKKRRW